MLRELGWILGSTRSGQIPATTSGRDPFGHGQQSPVRQAWAQIMPTTIGLSCGCLGLLNDPWVLYALTQSPRYTVSAFLRDICNLSLAAVFGDVETQQRIKGRIADCTIYDAGGQPAWFVNSIEGPRAFSLMEPAILEPIVLHVVAAVARVHWGISLIETNSRAYLKELNEKVLVPAFGVQLGVGSLTELYNKANQRRPLLSSQTLGAPVSTTIGTLRDTALTPDFRLESQWPVILGFMNELDRRGLGLAFSPDDAADFERWWTDYYQRATNYRIAGIATQQFPAAQTLTATDFFDISRGRVIH